MPKPGMNEYEDASKTPAPDAARIEHQKADGTPSNWAPSWDLGNQGPAKTVVYDGNDEVLLEYFRHANGPGHADDKGDLPETPKLADLDQPQNALARAHIPTAARIAQWATTEARRRLPLGPINQAFHFEGDDPKGPPSYVMGNASPGYYENLYELLHLGLTTNEDGMLSGFEKLLANFFATISVGAGVCANISALTAGLATLTAMPTWQVEGMTTTILRCSHNDGHSFAAVAYGRSPFIVADPWIAEPRLMFLEENCFGPEGIKTFEKIVVHRRLDTPFGIPLMAVWNNVTDPQEPPPPVNNLKITPAMVRLQLDEWKYLPAPGKVKDMRKDKTVELFAVKYGGWRANPAAKRAAPGFSASAGKPFHGNECLTTQETEKMRKRKYLVVWEQVSNDPGVEHYWRDCDPKKFERPLHTVDEWGDNAKHSLARGAVSPPPKPKEDVA